MDETNTKPDHIYVITTEKKIVLHKITHTVERLYRETEKHAL